MLFQNPDDESEFRSRGLVGPNTPTLVVNGSGVDITHYSPTPTSSDPIFLMIARLVAEKGVREYAEAARLVRRSHPEARFHLAGWIDSTPDAIDESLLNSWISEGTIEYLGALDDVRPALSRCRVYVLPSYREGTPRTVLEAMSMGRPIITTNAPGCRETVEHEVNGLLVRPRDSENLAQAMIRLIESSSLAEDMAQESRRIAVEKYDVHKVNAVILNCMGLS